MNRQRPQQDVADLVDEFWSLQNDRRSSEESDAAVEPSSDLEMELTAVAEALAPGRKNLGSTEYGRFLALHYSLLQNSRMTFLEFVKTRFIPEHVATKGPAGKRHYHAILKHILKPEAADALFDAEATTTSKRLVELSDWPYIDELRLCDINTDHVRKIISAALDKGYSVQTVKHIRNVIGTIITHAARRRCFSGDNPAFKVPLPRIVRRHEENLTIAQATRVLEVMRRPDREMALVAIFTGLNMLEICGLQWKYVNLTDLPRGIEGEFIFPRSIMVKKQWNAGELGDVRSARSRTVGISGLLLSLLSQLSQGDQHTKPDDLVFTSRSGGVIWPASLHERLKPLCGELEIPGLSWHQLTKAHKTLASELAAQLGQEEMPRM
jgi:integrase